jgi:hypothetical protein
MLGQGGGIPKVWDVGGQSSRVGFLIDFKRNQEALTCRKRDRFLRRAEVLEHCVVVARKGFHYFSELLPQYLLL